MQKDMTRIDFGWWQLYQPGTRVHLTWSLPHREVLSIGTQMDMWEFGTSRAAAWDCPATIMMDPQSFRKHPRAKDLLEVLHRWEEVRDNGFLTPERKFALRSTKQEHHLYRNGNGLYELHKIEMLPVAKKVPHLRGFVFERNDKRIVAYWQCQGTAKISVRLGASGEPVFLTSDDLRYYETGASKAEVIRAFGDAIVAELTN